MYVLRDMSKKIENLINKSESFCLIYFRHHRKKKFSSETCPGDFVQKVNFAFVLRYTYLYDSEVLSSEICFVNFISEICSGYYEL